MAGELALSVLYVPLHALAILAGRIWAMPIWLAHATCMRVLCFCVHVFTQGRASMYHELNENQIALPFPGRSTASHL